MDPETGLDGVRNVGIRDGKIGSHPRRIAAAGPGAVGSCRGLVVRRPLFIDLHPHGMNAGKPASQGA